MMAVVLPVDAEDYERRVGAATDPLDAFFNQLVSELNDNGGFTQWVGYSDWKTLTLLSDYLIQSVYGVSESLRLASFAARTHRESTYSDNEAMRSAARQGRSTFPLDAAGRRRHLVITQSLEGCFFHLGQALDRLTAAVVVVGGFEITEIAKLDWGKLEEIAEELGNGSIRDRYQPVGSKGRAAQEALVAPVSNWQTFGPPDWLPWERDTRNGLTHRAGGKKMVVMTTANRLARVLYRQPRWSELQSMIFGARPPRTAFYDAFVMSASEDVLEGLCESVAQLVEAITHTMVVCWDARTADPTMIVQHGRQWPVVEPTEAMWNFPGYAPITLAPGSMISGHPTTCVAGRPRAPWMTAVRIGTPHRPLAVKMDGDLRRLASLRVVEAGQIFGGA